MSADPRRLDQRVRGRSLKPQFRRNDRVLEPHRVVGRVVDARRAVVAAHLAPRPPHDVPAVDPVIQRVESSSGIGLGRPVERMLQGTDRAGLPTPRTRRHPGITATPPSGSSGCPLKVVSRTGSRAAGRHLWCCRCHRAEHTRSPTSMSRVSARGSTPFAAHVATGQADVADACRLGSTRSTLSA